MDSDSLELSAVVISWNQLELLRRLVHQLLNQDFPPQLYEVVVVDDGSTDGSREWLASIASNRLRVVFGDVNRGRSASRNAGILAARGRIIVMIDGDHTISPSFLDIHARRHRREACAIVGKSDFVDHPQYRALNHYLNNGGASKLPPGACLPGRYFLTRNCSVPRELLIRIGLFDETFTSWGGEDLDLGIRLAKAGVPIYGEPQARAIHHHLRPLRSLMRQVFEFGRSGIPHLLRVHPELADELKLTRVTRGVQRRASAFFLTAGTRVLLLAPLWWCALAVGTILRKHRLPRILFDYLHFRQYACGYLSHLKHLSEGGYVG